MPALDEPKIDVLHKPSWLKIRLHNAPAYAEVQGLVRRHGLHTICSSGRCPNQAECWSRRTATFMILGDRCTRTCRFCATASGQPLPPDAAEPGKVAESVRIMGLKHAVITSVTRDDLPDGGAAHWAATVRAIRSAMPETTIELLIPDLLGAPLETVLSAGADIVGHNIETVERLTSSVRSKAQYRRSLSVLKTIADLGHTPKSGLMLGLGETHDEVLTTLKDLKEAGVRIVTLGQYLRPTLEHHPVAAYITPEQFDQYKTAALEMGFDYCAAGPMVRSSYLADQALKAIRK